MGETLVFDSENVGVTMNDSPQDGQFAIEIEDRSEIAHFPAFPRRYRWDGSALVERPEWAQEEAARLAAEEAKTRKSAIAAQRFSMETSGVVEPVSGFTILTDRESQQILDSTIEKIRRGLVPSIRWKCKDGWLTLDENNITAIEILVLAHVQGAFAWEESEQIRLGLT